jgi:hypothetical protein
VGRLIATLILAAAGVAGGTDVAAQDMATRFGFGGGLVVNPSNREVADDDLGYDLRFRVSQPVSAGASLALDVGSFLFNEADQTEFVLNPQAMMIVTFGGEKRFPYVLAGVGAILPAEQDRESQLEIHAGFGWAWPFGSRMSAFVEFNPLVAFRESGIVGMVPARAGLIF